MAAESNILNRIRAALPGHARLFRNQTGHYVLADGRRLSSGLTKGSSDLIGWTSVEITPDMVGQRVAVFTAVEVKAQRRAPTAAQARFINAVQRAGGRAGIAFSQESALRIVDGG